MKPSDLVGKHVSLCLSTGQSLLGVLIEASEGTEFWCLEKERDGMPIFFRPTAVFSISETKTTQEHQRDLEMEGKLTPRLMREGG